MIDVEPNDPGLPPQQPSFGWNANPSTDFETPQPTSAISPSNPPKDPFADISVPEVPTDPEEKLYGFTPFDPSTSNVPVPESVPQEAVTGSLTPEQIMKAQKYCKYAGSALTYDDVSTAVQNLQKALRLLTTGQDS